MKLDDYNKLFDNCAKDKMVMEKYQPVKDQIIRICKHYIAKKEFKNNCRYEVRNHKRYNKTKIDFIRELLRLFNRIIKEKKYDNLDQIIDWLLANPDVTYYYFLTFFKVLVFKDDYKLDHDYFDIYWNNIDRMDYVFTRRTSINTEKIPIGKIIHLYRHYYQLTPGHEPNIYEEWRYVYMHLSPYVVGECYLKDYSPELAEEVFAYICYHEKDICDYIEMNYDDYSYNDNYKIQIVRLIIDNLQDAKVKAKNAIA